MFPSSRTISEYGLTRVQEWEIAVLPFESFEDPLYVCVGVCLGGGVSHFTMYIMM